VRKRPWQFLRSSRGKKLQIKNRANRPVGGWGISIDWGKIEGTGEGLKKKGRKKERKTGEKAKISDFLGDIPRNKRSSRVPLVQSLYEIR